MAVSVTTVVPYGTITSHWCIQEQQDFYGSPNECANSTLYPGETPADFDTICCDGDIVDTTQNLYQWPRPKNATKLYANIDNLICCRVEGPQQGGIGPINPIATACTEGTATPLASLAATNTKNAALYPVTYTSASFGSTTTGDFIPTQTPTCLWVNTVNKTSSQSMSEVTVEAAHITTLPPATTDEFGYPITTASSSYTQYITPSVTSSTPTPSATSTKSAAASNLQLPSIWSLLVMFSIGVLVLAEG